MAKLAVIVTVTVFFFALAFSDAVSLSNRLGDDVIVANLAAAEPDPGTTDPSNLAQTDGGEPDPPRSESGSESGPDSLASDEVNVPVTFVKFHPINRHFPRRPLAAVHFHRRPCHHRPNDMWGPGLKLPYGRDMILSGSGREAERVPDPFILRKIPATHRRRNDDDESDHVKDVENAQIDMSYGKDIVIPSEEMGSDREFEMRFFHEKKWAEEKKKVNKIKMKRHHRHEDDEQEMGFIPMFPGVKIPTTQLRIYPEEKHQDEDKDEKEYKGLFMKKVRKFLTHLV